MWHAYYSVFNLRFHDIRIKESGLNLPAAQGIKKICFSAWAFLFNKFTEIKWKWIHISRIFQCKLNMYYLLTHNFGDCIVHLCGVFQSSIGEGICKQMSTRCQRPPSKSAYYYKSLIVSLSVDKCAPLYYFSGPSAFFIFYRLGWSFCGFIQFYWS